VSRAGEAIAAGGAVLVGGLIGGSLRLGLDVAFPEGDFPLTTLLINVVGSLVLGVLVAGVWPRAPHWLRSGLGTGLIGTFTTFSAVAVSLVSLSAAGRIGTALVYLLVTLVGGLGAATLGLWIGGRMRPTAPSGTTPDIPAIEEDDE